ncbi:GrpB family protein [Aliiglaciecola sp. M165]|uniref:GrpB family protein n=1 Tax=Aliiglaciecola sp. M165 TaxID=2593649 RepID=UPI00118131BD|nr:GrpB family protein [Aliiglaciecola sp. M165]TRY31546.1 GrpB family protein [Aliiglaciecola sp. M165]
MRRDAIDIIHYQEIWQEQFNLAKEDLELALGEISVCIEHIGSTSIHDMPSKNRIDIQIGVRDISGECCELINTKLMAFGFPAAYISVDHLPPNEADEQQWKKIYLQGRTNRWNFKANIHIRAVGAKNFNYALLFRDYLRNNSEAAIAYARLKKSLAKYTQFDRNAYCEVKDPVCDLIMINARNWAECRE